MDRWEVTRKFDEIVAFAELEKFIDTPVKNIPADVHAPRLRRRRAPGAEILLVDEVL